MKIGFFTNYTAEIANFGAKTGFQSMQLSAWPSSSLNADKVGAGDIDRIKSDLDSKNIEISGLGYYPNVLNENASEAEEAQRYLKKVIELASTMGVGVVSTFAGRRQSQPVHESFEPFKEVFSPIMDLAEKKNVKIAIENCPMHDFMTGTGHNIAYNPEIWEKMFELVPSSMLGLEFDPSHCIWQQIDYVSAVKEFGHKIFHAHAKDLEIRHDVLSRVGVLGSATTFQGHVMAHGWPRARTPGWGDVDWPRFITALHEIGYQGNLDIEHEDEVLADSSVFSDHTSEADVVGNFGHDELGLTLGYKFLSQYVA